MVLGPLTVKLLAGSAELWVGTFVLAMMRKGANHTKRPYWPM